MNFYCPFEVSCITSQILPCQGGMGSVVEALVKAVEKFGGEVCTKVKVEEAHGATYACHCDHRPFACWEAFVSDSGLICF